jgi:hypothetical protein
MSALASSRTIPVRLFQPLVLQRRDRTHQSLGAEAQQHIPRSIASADCSRSSVSGERVVQVFSEVSGPECVFEGMPKRMKHLAG